MAQRAFFTNFRIVKEPEKLKKNEQSKEYILLTAHSYNVQRNGMYFNALFACYGDMKTRVEKMNLKKGSVVDIIAEMSQYKKGDSYETSYCVLAINFSEVCQQQLEEKKTPVKEETFMDKISSIFG